MIISICSKKEGMDSQVDERFGRSENFTIIEIVVILKLLKILVKMKLVEQVEMPLSY